MRLFGFIEGLHQLSDRAVPLLHSDGHAAQQHGLHAFGDIRAQADRIGQRHAAVCNLRGFRRSFAGYEEIQGRAQRIFIGPRVLRSDAAVLLDRSEAGPQRAAQPFHALICARRAEIQQHGLIDFMAQHDVIRADVAVNNAALMNLIQREHDRLHLAVGILPLKTAGALDHMRQRRSCDIFHDGIDGAVGRERVVHLNDVGDVLHVCNHPSFVQRPLAALCKLVAHAGKRLQRNGIPRAGHHFPREILLDRHPAGQIHVKTDIGNAESAVAQHLADQILPFQNHSGKISRPVRPVPVVMAASRTDRSRLRQLGHTAEAE